MLVLKRREKQGKITWDSPQCNHASIQTLQAPQGQSATANCTTDPANELASPAAPTLLCFSQGGLSVAYGKDGLRLKHLLLRAEDGLLLMCSLLLQRYVSWPQQPPARGSPPLLDPETNPCRYLTYRCRCMHELHVLYSYTSSEHGECARRLRISCQSHAKSG